MSSSASSSTASTPPSSSSNSPSYAAVVTGGTGAIGQYVVAELLASPRWRKVTVVGRRPWKCPATPPPGWEAKAEGDKAAAWPPVDAAAEEAKERLVQVSDADFEVLVDAKSSDHFSGADASFCCLGTTHGEAGGMAQFRRVDFDYVAASARLSKEGGCRHFSHVTAQGTGGFVSNLTNYGRTKARAEEYVKGLEFSTATIFRPGLLDRGEKARGMEWVAAAIVPSTAVATVARAMRVDAEQALGGGGGRAAAGAASVFRVVENGDIPGVAAGGGAGK